MHTELTYQARIPTTSRPSPTKLCARTPLREIFACLTLPIIQKERKEFFSLLKRLRTQHWETSIFSTPALHWLHSYL